MSDPVVDIQKFILEELDHFGAHFRLKGGSLTFYTQAQLLGEPFIGYLEVAGPEGYRYLLICRNYTPSDLKPKHPQCDYVSYLSSVGQIATSSAGTVRTAKVPTNNRHVQREIELTLKQKDSFLPQKKDGRWDAVRNDITWIEGRRFVPSLREYNPAVVTVAMRAVADRVQLPDQAILDDAQDTVFREPLNRFLVISGAPGTGKTTVLIKRLAQKTKYEFLSDEEKRFISADGWQENKNWVLFTPSDLLKNYLKESLGKEHLPATDQTVRVWNQYRSDLLRDINFLKAGNSGYFKRTQPGEMLVKRTSNAEAVALTLAFQRSLTGQLDQYYREEFNKFGGRIRSHLTALRSGMQALMEKALDYLTGAIRGDEQEADPTRTGQEFRGKAQQIDALLRYAEGLIAKGEKRADHSLSPADVDQVIQDTNGRLTKLRSISVPAHLFPGVLEEIDALCSRIEDLMNGLNFNTVFNRLPFFYHEFRTDEKNQKRFFAEGTEKQVNDRQIDCLEMDALLWVALELVTNNEPIVERAQAKTQAAYLLKQRQGMVAVDEATDFSAVELGCMRRLADPAFSSFTVCGDPMQRLTTQGIQDWPDMEEMVGKFSPNILRRSYRQTARLLQVAMTLYKNFMDADAPFASAYPLSPADPAPLAFKSSDDDKAEGWITERIVEIWQQNKQKLPSIGVFVPDGADEAGWVERLNQRLYENSINVEGSGNGANLGNADRVRVFPVSNIKGLEFEAAFFVDIDKMAEKDPELIMRYLYVGLSRARSYLGVTFTTQFPRRLSCVREFFGEHREFAPKA